MLELDGKLHRALVVYYGLVQSAHLIALIWEGLNYLRSSRLVLLAPPPAGGWTEGALTALLVLGALDGLLILASIPFLWGTLTRQPWRVRLGALILTAFSATAFGFALVTFPSGAWTQEPVYTIEVGLFLPVALLAALHLRWLRQGAGGRQSKAG